MADKKKCFRCGKEINEKGDFFTFREFSSGHFIREDYCHKKCWDEFMNKISDVSEARGMLKGLKKYFQNMGVLPPEEVEVELT